MPVRRAGAYFAALTAAVFACAILAASASAASYSVYACAGPSGEALPNTTWFPRLSDPSHSAAFTFGSSCADLSVTAAAGTALAGAESAGFAFDAPGGTSIAGYLLRRSAGVAFSSSSSNPGLSAGIRRTVSSGNTYAGECSAVTTACTIAESGTQSAGLDASSLQLGVECAQLSPACAAGKLSTLRAKLVEARVDLKDANTPTLSLTGGTLTDPNETSASRTLSVLAKDLGGGIRSVKLTIDGVEITSAASGGACTEPYTVTVPCPINVPVTFPVAVASYGNGVHTAVVSATDAAGNVGTLTPINFTLGAAGNGVVGSGSGSTGTPVVTIPSLVTSKSLIDGTASRSVSVGGFLLTTSGDPIVGATLDVSSVNLGGSDSTSTALGSVVTGVDGSFNYKLKPSGAQRITFAYRPRAGANQTASASTIVRERIALTAKGSSSVLSYGGKLTISGRLGGAGAAAGGAPVEIQVAAGKKWIAVDSVSTSKSGKYKWQHRFKRVTRPTLFRFRAVVRGSKTWPWATKASSSVKVLVR
jgi:hypothetical protein